MKLKNINEIKKLESSPKIVNLFSEKEIKDILDLYKSLPETSGTARAVFPNPVVALTVKFSELTENFTSYRHCLTYGVE